ncbi:MAG: NAD-dependent epimerase/dehydratase family protein [candidate division FCPU426 bacterium]
MAETLVTGATGFIGSHLVESLLADRHAVRCLVRRTSNPRWLPVDRVRLVQADLESGEGLDAALAGVEVVFHLAGATKALSRREYQASNVAATRRLLAAVARNAPHLKRFVFLSSQAAAGPAPAAQVRDESHACSPLTHYGASKLEAERVLAEHPEIPAVVLRSVSVYGPRDRDMLELVKPFRRGFAPVIGQADKRLTFVHVADLVQALRLAAEHPAAVGQTYFVTDGRQYNWAEVKAVLERVAGRRARSLRIPLPAVWLVAAAAGAWARITGRPSILNLNRFREFRAANWSCSSEKLQRELGFKPRFDLETGLRETVAWARENRWF